MILLETAGSSNLWQSSQYYKRFHWLYEKVTNHRRWTNLLMISKRNAWELLYKMAAFGSAFCRLNRRGVFQTARAFSLGSTSHTSVAVVSLSINLKAICPSVFMSPSFAGLRKAKSNTWRLFLVITDRSLFMGGGEMGEKMGGPEILATAKRGVLGKVFVIEGGSWNFKQMVS